MLALGLDVLGVELVAALLTARRAKVLVVLLFSRDGGVAVHVVGRVGLELVATWPWLGVCEGFESR